ncbi:hypothetical protein [Parasitella parasitica]|uniref:Uncharacterized protein n=1 Tax=Parasitella parasitica TaxID=35722 RepID=A0A0B7N6L7_9FUNG|nr:hypothetical protein [Parasitella parasitica]
MKINILEDILGNEEKQEQGIAIKGQAAKLKKLNQQQHLNVKTAFKSYSHSKDRITIHEKIRSEKLNEIILPHLKVELERIRREHNNMDDYRKAREKYIFQFFQQKHEARAFIKKHLKNF